jgi:hypothetical protein
MDLPAEMAYIEWASRTARQYQHYWGELSTLMSRPDAIVGAQWKQDMTVTAAMIVVLSDEIIDKTNVPPRFSEIHSHYVAAADLYRQSIYAMAEGLDTLNADKIHEATTLLEQGTAQIREATRLTDEFTASQ